MKKFSRINESFERSYFDWSPKDIEEIIESSGEILAVYNDTFFVFKMKEEDIIVNTNYMISEEYNDCIFYPLHEFRINFMKLPQNNFIETGGNENSWCDGGYPFSKVIEDINLLDNLLINLKKDFFIFINRDDKKMEESDITSGITLDLIQKEGFTKEYILSDKKN